MRLRIREIEVHIEHYCNTVQRQPDGFACDWELVQFLEPIANGVARNMKWIVSGTKG